MIPRILSIAGSDSGGGAGLQADLKTYTALGCFGMTAVTVVTAQNTYGVHGIHPLPASFVEAQIEAVLTDMGADTLKIGMLFDVATIETVSSLLRKYASIPAVLDPVMIAKDGASLLLKEALTALKQLLPQVLLVTPNLEEVSSLLGRRITQRDEMPTAGRDLLVLGAKNALIKGGHLEIPGSDCLLTQDGQVHWFEAPVIATLNTHGTGCTFSSAIAAFLARGSSLIQAVGEAKNFLQCALVNNKNRVLALGSGRGPCVF